MGVITLLPFLLVPGLIAAGMVWLLEWVTHKIDHKLARLLVPVLLSGGCFFAWLLLGVGFASDQSGSNFSSFSPGSMAMNAITFGSIPAILLGMFVGLLVYMATTSDKLNRAEATGSRRGCLAGITALITLAFVGSCVLLAMIAGG